MSNDVRPLAVYLCGGLICGNNFLNPVKERDWLQEQLLEALAADGFVATTIRITPRKELLIEHDVTRIILGLTECQIASEGRPLESLILLELSRMFDLAARLESVRAEQFPDAVITLVGSPVLLGSTGSGGDPGGLIALSALRHATRGPIKAPGIYLSDPTGCYHFREVQIVMQLRLKPHESAPQMPLDINPLLN